MGLRDRRGIFPGSSPDEISVFSWNVLAPLYQECDMTWGVRLPALIRCISRFTACDVLCFQEVDRALFLSPLCDTLSAYGFTAVVQERKGFPVVNATFFKSRRLRHSWSDHRSRALLVGLLLANGHEIVIGNVHLEAGAEKVDHAQRRAQLTSALRRLQERKPSYAVICGDFNSAIEEGTHLHHLLHRDGFLRTESGDFCTHAHGTILDHVWAGTALKANLVLGSPYVLDAMLGAGLPSLDNPSDHLPVAALFSVSEPSGKIILAVEIPVVVDEVMRQEWLHILRLARVGACKQARKEQRRLEQAFLAQCSDHVAAALGRWREGAARAGEVWSAALVARALVRLRAEQRCAEAEAVISGTNPALRGG